MEIIVERLRREYDIDLISTSPSVEYRITMEGKPTYVIDNPCDFPDGGKSKFIIQEPYIKGNIIVPKDYVGSVMELCQEKRGILHNLPSFITNRTTTFHQAFIKTMALEKKLAFIGFSATIRNLYTYLSHF